MFFSFLKVKSLVSRVKRKLDLFNSKKLSSEFSFIKLQVLSNYDKDFLAEKGICVDYLHANFDSSEQCRNFNHCDRDISVSETVKNDASYRGVKTFNIPRFQNDLLFKMELYLTCPFCGGLESSRLSFPVFELGFDLPIFYKFDCCHEVFMLVGKSPQKILGLYFPIQKLVVSYEDYLNCPYNHFYYSKESFLTWYYRFMKLKKKYRDQYDSYCQISDKRLCILPGYLENFGHHLNDELGGLFELHEDSSYSGEILLGPKDWFSCKELFPHFHYCPLKFNEEEVLENLFKYVLMRNLTVLRLTHYGELQEALANQIVANSKKKCSQAFLKLIKESKRSNPLVWITLRSHTRYWVNEVEAIPTVLSEIFSDYPNLGIVFDGSPDVTTKFQIIKTLLPQGISVYSSIGCEFHEAITWVSLIDFFIAPFGNGTNFTSINNKPGVLHTHNDWSKNGEYIVPNRRENGTVCRLIGGNIESGHDVFDWNYSIPPEKLLGVLKIELEAQQSFSKE